MDDVKKIFGGPANFNIPGLCLAKIAIFFKINGMADALGVG
jgi:hypothetical protein